MVKRIFLALAALTLLVALGQSAQAEEVLYPDLKVNSEGVFKGKDGKHLKARVEKVIAINAVIVRVGERVFLLSEIKTKDLAEDDLIELKGLYRVRGTFKYRGTTYKEVVKKKE